MCFESNPWSLQEAWRRLCIDHDDFCRFMKLNVDGSYRLQENQMGFGGLLRDEKGIWLAGFMGMECAGSALLAEALAMREGLKMSLLRGHRCVYCESDNQELVRFVKGR